jgi:Na+/melibiose symporter-like transporter
MATTTAGNVLAVQGQPEPLWDARVATLQRYISAGQVVGLSTAGLLARSRPGAGFVVAGLALLAAGALAVVSAPQNAPRSPAAKPAPRPMMGGDAGVSGPHHRGHHLSWPEFRANLRVLSRPLRHFLIVWLVAYPAMNGFATLFPVAMTRQFGMDPIFPACAYSVGVAASLLLYPPVGAATHHLGGGQILISGIGARLFLLAVLVVGSFSHFGWISWLVLIGFALIQFVWPLLAVGANSLSVRLAPTAQGESVGLFNATTSLAAALGSALAGVIFGDAGFAGLAAAAFVAVAVALALSALWLKEWQERGAI